MGPFRSLTKNGYISVYDLKRDGKRQLHLEHRVVMEALLGRKLTRREYVHHINGNPADNRPENLMVMTPAEHTKFHADMRKGDLKCR